MSPPHARGGAPTNNVYKGGLGESSPRTWGCSVARDAGNGGSGVLPTHVGVLRDDMALGDGWTCPPHARGGAPSSGTEGGVCLRSSPRTWGCSAPGRRRLRRFRSPPHARGGAPAKVLLPTLGALSSPRTWGCSGGGRRPRHWHRVSPRTWGCSDRTPDEKKKARVLPTHVGVLRRTSISTAMRRCPPHARGGAPPVEHPSTVAQGSSPRTWGCSAGTAPAGRADHVLPTHVGVLRHRHRRRPTTRGPPHARGGAPAYRRATYTAPTSSPRTWGCSACSSASRPADAVLPTHVGVLRRLGPRSGQSRSSSPHTWGCSALVPRSRPRCRVLPTTHGSVAFSALSQNAKRFSTLSGLSRVWWT